MKTLKFEDREAWLAARRGKITGTRLKDIVVKRGTGMKKGYYELIAERLAVEPDGEDPMQRGTRLEEEALARFAKETGKFVNTDLIIWHRDENENIAISPDGSVGETEAIDIKCLSSASHLEAWLTQEIPSEYEFQKLQYFIVNDMLSTLYFAFYDPRIPAKDFFFIKVERKEIEKEIAEYLEYERNILKLVNEEVNKLTF